MCSPAGRPPFEPTRGVQIVFCQLRCMQRKKNAVSLFDFPKAEARHGASQVDIVFLTGWSPGDAARGFSSQKKELKIMYEKEFMS